MVGSRCIGLKSIVGGIEEHLTIARREASEVVEWCVVDGQAAGNYLDELRAAALMFVKHIVFDGFREEL